jgi:hypothetical protein
MQIIFHICAANRAGFDLDDNPTVRTLGYIHLHDLYLAGTTKNGLFHFHGASLKKIVIVDLNLIPYVCVLYRLVSVNRSAISLSVFRAF